MLEGAAGRAALVAFDSAVAALPEELSQQDLDDLAAEYATSTCGSFTGAA